MFILRQPLTVGVSTLWLTLALTACGGGGGGGSSPATVSTAAPGVAGVASSTSGQVSPPSVPVAPTAPTAPTAPNSPNSPAASTPVASTPVSPPAPTPELPASAPVTTLACTASDVPTVRAAAFGLINIIRTALQLPLFIRTPAIDAIAQSHAQYAVTNGSRSSEESAALPCYTGATLRQRLADAGVVPGAVPGARPTSESVLLYAATAAADVAVFDIVNEALNNLYGRLLLLAPQTQQLGVGVSSQPNSLQRSMVLDTALPADASAMESNSWVVWPRDGATGLPVRMRASNFKPLDDSLTEGYPMSLHAAAAVQVSRFVMTQASNGALVSTTLITSATDRQALLRSGEAALVPNAPLTPGMQYRVELDATVGSLPIHQVWFFTTAP